MSAQLDGVHFTQWEARFAGRFDVTEEDLRLDGNHIYVVIAREEDALIKVKQDGDVRRTSVLKVEDARRVDDEVMYHQAMSWISHADDQGFLSFPEPQAYAHTPEPEELVAASEVTDAEYRAALEPDVDETEASTDVDTIPEPAELAGEPEALDEEEAPDDEDDWSMPVPSSAGGGEPSGRRVGSIHRPGYQGDPVLQKWAEEAAR